MYKKILIALENSRTDAAILEHIKPLVKMMKSAVVLVHVADGWAARNYNELELAESREMKEDRAYLERVRAQLESEGIAAQELLLLGEPADEIIKLAQQSDVDLIAMSTHGHRFLSDMIYGTTVDKVRHKVEIPVLLFKAPRA